MKKYLIFLVFLILIPACDSGSGPTSPSHPPAISNLWFSPQSATLNQGGGAITVYAYVDFIDAGGDLSTITTVNYTTGTSRTDSIQGASGLTAGTIEIIGIVSTTQRVSYSFGIYVTDSTGANSNTLTGTFVVN